MKNGEKTVSVKVIGGWTNWQERKKIGCLRQLEDGAETSFSFPRIEVGKKKREAEKGDFNLPKKIDSIPLPPPTLPARGEHEELSEEALFGPQQ